MENQENPVPAPEQSSGGGDRPKAKIPGANLEQFYYDNKIVRDFGIASVAWGVISLLVGIYIACEIGRAHV